MQFRFLPILAIGLVSTALVAQQAPRSNRGVQVAHFDTTVKPCEDFYQYANGTWLKTSTIPGEYPAWGAFMEIYENNIAILKGIMEDASKDAAAPKGSIIQKVGDFYSSGMDTEAIEKAGLKPLASRFQSIQGMRSGKDLARVLAGMHMEGMTGIFGLSVGADDRNSMAYIAQLAQDGLGLPECDYYTKDDDTSKQLRAKYEKHVSKMFEQLGDSSETADRNARVVMDLETRMAKASMTAVERRDPVATYNKVERRQLLKDANGFEWETYFEVLGLPASEKHVLVRQPKFFKEVGLLARQVPIDQWKTYLRWHLIHGTAGKLNDAIVQANFEFYGKALNGTQELSPRWKRVQGSTDAALGEALGQLYVAKVFKPSAKARALEIVKNLQTALRERISKLDWMKEGTKQKALKKLDTFIVKIGYPDKWRDYSKLHVSRESYVLNFLAANLFETQRAIAKLGKPVDRSEWGMNPQDVNAYYEPTTNEICFPAGILQAPFFDAEADDAVNYGGIGMVIGHEMTHGFDDQGCQYDAQGNLNNWWTPADTDAFKARQDIVIKQYDAYKPLSDMAINGKLTLGENIADLGGLKIAFSALMKALEGKAKPSPIDGFSAEQRFFLGYAQAWRTLMRPEMLRVQISTDPHSPAKYRVIGPLSNLPEFQTAFGCSEGTSMVRPAKDRPTIW